jgi:hypothetical protein
VHTIALILRLLVAIIITWPELAKPELVDRSDSRRESSVHGKPAKLATPFALFVTVTQFIDAGLLTPMESTWCGAIATLVLVCWPLPQR